MDASMDRTGKKNWRESKKQKEGDCACGCGDWQRKEWISEGSFSMLRDLMRQAVKLLVAQ